MGRRYQQASRAISWIGRAEDVFTSESNKPRHRKRVGLAQPSAVQASLYRLHFGNPEISPTGFHFCNFYLIIAWNAKTIGVFISISIRYFP
jgi:hypothetical protein